MQEQVAPSYTTRHFDADNITLELNSQHKPLSADIVHQLLSPSTDTTSDYLADVHNGYITATMRSEVVGFTISLGQHVGLASVTVERAVRLFDAGMQVEKVRRATLQVLSAAAVLVSAGMEGAGPSVPVSGLTALCEGVFTAADLVHVEQHLLEIIGWQANVPTSHTALAAAITCLGLPVQEAGRAFTVASGLIALGLQSYPMSRLPPATLGRAALRIALGEDGDDSLASLGVDRPSIRAATKSLVSLAAQAAGHGADVTTTPTDMTRCL